MKRDENVGTDWSKIFWSIVWLVFWSVAIGASIGIGVRAYSYFALTC